ncbi:MAG: hypothetical protein JJU21_02540 [Salinarimonas sp.]|nr:hypothetical protein [Salinarimonas sp.]
MFHHLLRMTPGTHLAATGAAFAGFMGAQTWLDASYEASGHPVHYAEGQLAFSAERVEYFYGVMLDAGTLDIYWRTQIIDFAFIASVMILSALLGTLVARLGGVGSFGYRAGIAAAVLGIAGASMDVIENLISFIMLANPQDISQTVAVVYSSFAAAKFALLSGAMITLKIALLAGLFRRARVAFA